MKHIYLSTDDIGDGLSVLDGKVKVSENYLTVAQSDAKYQASGTYATSEELTAVDAKVDGLVDVYQPLGNYITTEDADLKYLTNESLVDYATKEYVDQAVANSGGSSGGSGEPGSGEGFDGNYTGETNFTGNMRIVGELTVDSLYDTVGTRQILPSDIVTVSDLNDLLPGIGGGGTPSEYVLPIATNDILGGIKIGTGLQITEDGTVSVEAQTGGGDTGTPAPEYVLPPSTASTLGGVIIGENINVTEDGTISVTFPVIEDVVIPVASTTTAGIVKIGSGLSVSSGVISVPTPVIDEAMGDFTVNGNLIVSGGITYAGDLTQGVVDTSLQYKNNSLKVLFENGRIMNCDPVTAGEITYNEDGTFTDGASYFGKLTPEGYLDLSVQNQVMTSLSNCNLLGVNCIWYVEIVGKLNTTNSIFAALVREDKATGNTFAGTKNASSTNSLGSAMTDGLNKILFVPTSGGKGKLFLNGALLGTTDGQYAMLQIVNSTDTNIMLGYCWSVGGTGKLKKLAGISYADYGYSGDADGIEITSKGFVDTPIPAIRTLSLESRVSELERKLNLLLNDIPHAMQSQPKSQNPQTKPMTVFKRRT